MSTVDGSSGLCVEVSPSCAGCALTGANKESKEMSFLLQ